VADFKNEVMAREGDNAMGFDLHNYSVEDLPEDSSGRPEDFRIGDKGYLSVFPDATLRSLPEIFSELAWERVYVVEIPAVYKEMSERVRRRLLHTLHLYGERPLSYETTVVDMRKSHEIGLDQLCVVRKIADLIEQSETWERQMEEAM
jgi:hypothetical protein